MLEVGIAVHTRGTRCMLRRIRILGGTVLAAVVMGGRARVVAQQVKDAREAAARNQEAARRSQEQIDTVVDATRSLERQYGAVVKELEGLDVYNVLLQRQIANQPQELADLQSSIGQVTVIERQGVPLVAPMGG